MFDGKAVIYLALIGTICGGTARAEDAPHKDFADHFFKACMPFVLNGRSPDSYVQHAVSKVHVRTTGSVISGPMAYLNPSLAESREIDKVVEVRKLEPADPDLVPDTLHGQKGRIFSQTDEFTPMTLTLSDNGVCSVAANNMPDVVELVATTEKRLAAFSPQFSKKDESEFHDADGSAITSREYTAELNGHKFLVTFSATLARGPDQVGQAVVTVAKSADN